MARVMADVEDPPLLLLAPGLIEGPAMREALLDQARDEDVGPLQALRLVDRAEDEDLVRLVGRDRVHAVDVAGQDHVGDQPLEAVVPAGQQGELLDVGDPVLRPLVLEPDGVRDSRP